MLDQHFRKVLPQLVGPLIKLYTKWHITPNHLTLIGMAIGILAAVCVALKWHMAALTIWWLGRLLDGTDGILARATGQSSFLGAYLDISCDMVAYGAMILGFAVAYPSLGGYWMVILFLYILCITTALTLGNLEEKLAIGADQGRGARLAAGLAEAGETGIAYTLFLLFPGHLRVLATIWIVILIITVVSRSLLAKEVLTSPLK